MTPSSAPAEKPAAGSPALALTLVALAVLFWGASFMATKSALTAGFSPLTVVWLRMAIASLALAPFWWRMPRPAYRRGDAWWLLLICLLQPGLYYLCENYAVSFTTSSQAGMISAIVPLLVAVGAWLFLRERVSGRTLAGIAISIAGVVALSLGAHASAHAPNPVLGNTLEVVSMASAAVSMIALKRLVDRYDPWMLTGIQALAGVVLFAPGALASDPRTWLAKPLGAWLALGYLGVFVSLAAFGLYAMALKRMPANQAAVAINAVPLVALVAGWAVLGESLGGVQLLGCAAIAAGVALGQIGGGPAPQVETALGEG